MKFIEGYEHNFESLGIPTQAKVVGDGSDVPFAMWRDGDMVRGRCVGNCCIDRPDGALNYWSKDDKDPYIVFYRQNMKEQLKFPKNKRRIE